MYSNVNLNMVRKSCKPMKNAQTHTCFFWGRDSIIIFRRQKNPPNWVNPSRLGLIRVPLGTNPSVHQGLVRIFDDKLSYPCLPVGNNLNSWQINYGESRLSQMNNPLYTGAAGDHSLDQHEADRWCSQVSEFTLTHCLGLFDDDECRTCRRLIS